MPTSDELNELVQAVAVAQDRQAFAVLFKHFAPRVKAYLMRAGAADGAAEELTQEAMLSVWRKAASFDPQRARVSTWIFTIARNLRIDGLRRHAETFGDAPGAPTDDDVGRAHELIADPAAPLDEQLASGRRERGVRRAMDSLPHEQALILRLSFFDDQPHARIARELAIPLGTVKSRIRLAVLHLRRALDGFES